MNFNDKTERFIERFFDHLSNWVVLEPGAFNGRNTKFLCQYAKEVICVEPRKENVDLLSELAAKNANIRIIQDDIREVDPTDVFCDIIFHSGVLYHLDNPEEHLKTIFKWSSRLWLNTHHGGDLNRNYIEKTDCPRAGLQPHSVWLSRDGLLWSLMDLYDDVEIISESMEENGPRIEIYASV